MAIILAHWHVGQIWAHTYLSHTHTHTHTLHAQVSLTFPGERAILLLQLPLFFFIPSAFSFTLFPLPKTPFSSLCFVSTKSMKSYTWMKVKWIYLSAKKMCHLFPDFQWSAEANFIEVYEWRYLTVGWRKHSLSSKVLNIYIYPHRVINSISARKKWQKASDNLF